MFTQRVVSVILVISHVSAVRLNNRNSSLYNAVELGADYFSFN